MIKKEEVTIISTFHYKYCDICQKKISSSLACCAAHCEYCGKDLCEDCIEHENNSFGDYREVYCKRCWEIYLKYDLKIKELNKQLDDIYEQIEKECRHE